MDNYFDPMSSRIIDGDNYKILEWFDPAQSQTKIKEYRDKGYEDVSTDSDGDIIVYREY